MCFSFIGILQVPVFSAAGITKIETVYMKIEHCIYINIIIIIDMTGFFSQCSLAITYTTHVHMYINFYFQVSIAQNKIMQKKKKKKNINAHA